MTVEEVKEFLSQGKYVELRIKAKTERIDQLWEIATSITAQPKDGPGGGGGPSKKIEDCAIAIADMQTELTEEILELQKTSQSIKTVIFDSSLPAAEKTLLELRYVNQESWDTIAEKMCIAQRWAYRLQLQALEALAKNWPF